MGATKGRGARARWAEEARWLADVERTVRRETAHAPPAQKHDAVAWVLKDRAGLTVGVSAVHRVFEDGRTFCKAILPGIEFQFPPLASLNVCSKCERMSTRVRDLERRAAKFAVTPAA